MIFMNIIEVAIDDIQFTYFLLFDYRWGRRQQLHDRSRVKRKDNRTVRYQEKLQIKSICPDERIELAQILTATVMIKKQKHQQLIKN